MEIRAKVMPLMSNSLLTFYYSSLELNYEFLINIKYGWVIRS